ncbi:MAG: 4Fe-4S dicluster domain-containing protein [Candidatus Ranarchaeia archaeon]
MAKPKENTQHVDDSPNMVTIYLMGRPYKVPSELTIMKAMEYIGYQIIRGAGCRGGFCGACATVYRKEDDYYLYADLACQKTVEDGMYITMLPFTPAQKKIYDLKELNSDGSNLLRIYPVIARCVACNTCTKACPQELNVMDYVQAAIRGDIQAVAELSFDCIHCGLCAMRCPAMIVPYYVGQLARRIYGRYIQPASPGIASMVKRVEDGEFSAEIDRLANMPLDELKEKYVKRKITSLE